MTKSLDAYLRGPYKEDGTFLKTLRSKIEEVMPIFHKQSIRLPIKKRSQTRVLTWPYAVSFDVTLRRHAEFFSASTHCMILFALDALASREEKADSILLGPGFRPAKFSGERGKKILARISEGKNRWFGLLSSREIRWCGRGRTEKTIPLL